MIYDQDTIYITLYHLKEIKNWHLISPIMRSSHFVCKAISPGFALSYLSYSRWWLRAQMHWFTLSLKDSCPLQCFRECFVCDRSMNSSWNGIRSFIWRNTDHLEISKVGPRRQNLRMTKRHPLRNKISFTFFFSTMTHTDLEDVSVKRFKQNTHFNRKFIFHSNIFQFRVNANNFLFASRTRFARSRIIREIPR